MHPSGLSLGTGFAVDMTNESLEGGMKGRFPALEARRWEIAPL
jgi:hypothetical protein